MKKRSRAGQREDKLRLERDVEHYFLRGFSPAKIADELGISVTYVKRFLIPMRRTLREGGYAAELRAMAARGFSNLPTPASVSGNRKGRPIRPFTHAELAIRRLHQLGHMRPRDLAKLGKMSRQRLYALLRKAPSVFKKRPRKNPNPDLISKTDGI